MSDAQVGISDDPKELLRRHPLGTPPLRESMLSSSPSRLEKLSAAPSDEELQTMWTIWSAVFAVYSVIILVVFFGIVCSKRVRAQPFNHYLIYLMLPDILYTVVCTFQCGLLAILGGPNTPFSCSLQSFYLIFGNGANSWMNAIIAYQLHRLLWTSQRGARYLPPTNRQIAFHAFCAYAFAAFIAVLGILPIYDIPVQTTLFYGLGCVASSYDTMSSIFFWLFYYPAFALVPMLYLLYVTVDIYRNNLLPREGRRRQLSLYYVRMLVAVYVMWFPALIFVYGFALGAWAFMYVGLWIHAQGAVSAICSVMKEDVYRAVRNLLCCQCHKENDTSNTNQTSQRAPSSRALKRAGSSFLTISGVSLLRMSSQEKLSFEAGQEPINAQQKILRSQASSDLQSIDEYDDDSVFATGSDNEEEEAQEEHNYDNDGHSVDDGTGVKHNYDNDWHSVDDTPRVSRSHAVEDLAQNDMEEELNLNQ